LLDYWSESEYDLLPARAMKAPSFLYQSEVKGKLGGDGKLVACTCTMVPLIATVTIQLKRRVTQRGNQAF
jgi:hypothetical protein